MRILALDWGTVRVGGAVSDPDGKISFPLEKFIESKNAFAEIKKLVSDLGVEKILIGKPKTLEGKISKSTELAENFAQKLKELNLPIESVDERLSSIGASKTLSSQGIKKKNQKELTDNLAAQQMLQTYLDNKTN